MTPAANPPAEAHAARGRRKPAAIGRVPALSLHVQYAATGGNLPTRSQFRRWARAALMQDARITLRVTGAAEARVLNRRYRQRDYATNVLTFVLSEATPLEGDVALCAPVIAREARAQGKLLAAHYAHLTIHGVLHLQGYDHQRPAQAARMERIESAIMSKLGYPDPYAAPA